MMVTCSDLDGHSRSEQYVSPEGLIHWRRVGSGPPVVLVHGTPFCSVAWRDVAAGLALTRTVYLWDLAGFGQSEQRPDQHVDLDTQAHILADLLNEWDLEQPSVVAHDVGGAVALGALMLHGARYRDLTLADAVSVPGWSDGAFFHAVRTNPEAFTSLPADSHRALARSKIVDASYRGLSDHAVDSYLAPWLGPKGQAAFYRQYAQASEDFTARLEPLLRTLDLPTQILWARQDHWLPAPYLERARAAIRPDRFNWIEDSGHLVQEDAPAELLAQLLDWFHAIEATPTSRIDGELGSNARTPSPATPPARYEPRERGDSASSEAAQ